MSESVPVMVREQQTAVIQQRPETADNAYFLFRKKRRVFARVWSSSCTAKVVPLYRSSSISGRSRAYAVSQLDERTGQVT